MERTYGWFMHRRRLARNYETHSHRSEAMIHLAMIDPMTRRLTRETTPNWRGTQPRDQHESADQTLSQAGEGAAGPVACAAVRWSSTSTCQ